VAGVSLALRNLFGNRSYFAQSAGYAYAGIAMAGPWLVTSVYMQFLNATEIPGVTLETRQFFQTFVLYGYCGSMILTGLIQLGVARYVGDRLYVGDTRGLTPSYASASLVALVLHGFAAGVFILFSRPDPLLAFAELAFFGSVAMVWTGMIFLGVVRNFVLIFFAFLAGMAASFVLSWILGPRAGLAGLLLGFAAGHALIGAALGAGLRAEFPADRPFDFGFLRTMVRHPGLVITGLAYAAGVWIDKIVFWASPYSVHSGLGVRSFPIYDNAAFLAYLTATPSLALVFIRLEVSFHEKYSKFYDAIRQGADLETIRECRKEIARSFRLTLARILMFQAALTALAILLAPELLSWIRLDWSLYYSFRFLCIGAMLQVLMLGVLLAAIHLAFNGIALGMALAYLLVAGGGTWASLHLGPEFYGVGNVLAALAALAIGYPPMSRALGSLERRTFMSQPV
jgi:uncharacterized membrane protein